MTALDLPRGRARRIALLLLALFWTFGGINHFLNPAFYVSIMPPYFPAHLGLVYLTGILEIAGGIGVLLPATRQLAGWGLIALLFAFMPVHVHMIVNSEIFVAQGVPYWGLWARLPIQALFLAWAWWATRPESEGR
jgi:uncharacterized membrane protein